MNVAILVNSRGGNTRMVAGAIKKAVAGADANVMHLAAIPDTAEAAALDAEVRELDSADVVMVGFWCDKGTCTPGVTEILGRLNNKKVFLFGTCGYGASDEYFKQIIDRVTTGLSETSELIGWAMCQGKMGPAVRERYEAALKEAPEDERIQALIANYEVAKSHPTKQDLENMANAAVRALENA